MNSAEPWKSPTSRLILRLLLSLGALIWLAWRFDWTQVFSVLRNVPGQAFGGGVAFYALAQIFSALKWSLLLRGLGRPVPLGILVQLYFIGMFSNFYLPTSIGGDAVRTYLLARRQGFWELGALSIFMERFTGLIAMLIWGGVGALLLRSAATQTEQQVLVVSGLLLAISLPLGLIALSLLRRTRLARWLPRPALRLVIRVQEGLRRYARRPGQLALVLGMSLAFQLGMVGLNGFLAAACGIHLPWRVWLLMTPLITLASTLPVSLGGLGVRETACVFFLRTLEVEEPAALAASLLWQMVVLSTSLPGGFALLGTSKLTHPPNYRRSGNDC